MSAVEDILLADSSQEAFAKLNTYDQALFCYRQFEIDHLTGCADLRLTTATTRQTLVNAQSARVVNLGSAGTGTFNER